MKKKNLLLIFTLVLVLTACGPRPKATVQTLFAGIRNLDLEAIEGLVDPDLIPGQDLKFFKELLTEEEDPFTLAFLNYSRSRAQKIQYEILEENLDKDRAQVKLKVKYVDSKDLIIQTMKDYVSQTMALVYFEGDLDQEDFDSIRVSIFQDLVEAREDQFVEKDLDLDLVKKDGTWYLEDFNKDLINLALANLIEAFESLNQEEEGPEASFLEDLTQLPRDQTLKLQTISIDIRSVEESSSLINHVYKEETWANEGAKFLIIGMDVENITKEPLDLRTDIFLLRDSEDRIFESYEDTIGSIDNYISMRRIGPSLVESGYLVFQVPEEAQGFGLLMKNGATNESYEIVLD